MGLFDFLKREKVAVKETKSENLVQDMRKRLYGDKAGYSSRFVSDIYDDTILTPHEEMLRCRKAYDYNAYIGTSANTFSNFIIGGATYFSTADEETETLINKLYKDTKLKSIYEQFLITDLIVYGNAYVERLKSKDTGLPVSYKYITKPERMYIDFDDTGEKVSKYILEVPEVMSNAPDVKFYSVAYYGNMRQKSIRGISIPTDKVFHLHIGKNTIDKYGRGYVATIINDYLVSVEGDRAVAILLRNKAIKKKLLHLKGATLNELLEITKNLSALSDFVNPATGYSGDIDLKDLSDTNNVSDIIPLLNYNKRKLTIGMAPEYILHGEETNRSTGREQKMGYQLAISTMRAILENFMINEMSYLLKKYGLKVPSDLEFKHGDFEEFDEEGLKQRYLDGWREGFITLNEVRGIYNLNEDDADGDKYKFQLADKSEVEETFENASERLLSRFYFDKGFKAESINSNNLEQLKVLTEYISANLDAKAKVAYDKLVRAYLKGNYRFIWRTEQDDRVRSSHRKRDGREYYILQSLYFKQEFPGWAANCRCRAEIVRRKRKK